VIRSPPGAPKANAYEERFVPTARRELLDRTLIGNEHQLHQLLVEYLEHYNSHRPHRSLNQRPPDTADLEVAEPVPIDKIRRRPILSGPINEYHSATSSPPARPAPDLEEFGAAATRPNIRSMSATNPRARPDGVSSTYTRASPPTVVNAA
jgi:hypothetical protein